VRCAGDTCAIHCPSKNFGHGRSFLFLPREVKPHRFRERSATMVRTVLVHGDAGHFVPIDSACSRHHPGILASIRFGRSCARKWRDRSL
jgi:hypothetical protein